MRAFGRGGLAPACRPGVAGFGRPSERLAGNDLPPWTGSTSGPRTRPGPGPSSGGQLGHYDAYSGADTAAPPVPRHRSVLGEGQETFRRFALQGFNDQLQYRDRHAYYDRGTQRTGITRSVPGNPPNQHSDGPARPDLRTVNRSVNPQIGSDASRNQDDLSRPYTWLGQWDGTTQAVYGGVPGLWVPYGTRGGVPYAIQSPVPEGGPGDGPAMVFSGPPHGLHSQTIAGGRQVLERFESTPQMRPVRLDRPDNSAIAGQSYSQTVTMQGAAAAPPPGAGRSGSGLSLRVAGRGWLGG